MIKISTRVIVFTLFLCVVVGCSNQQNNTYTQETHNISKIEEGEVTSYEDVFVASDVKEDLNGDGEKERIILRISPAPVLISENPKQYGWDDSHIWQLLVEDHEGNTYPLFDDSVQFSGQMYIVSKENNEKAIIFELNGTSLKLIEYRFNTKGYFEKEIMYKNRPIIHKSSI
ncbi:hypothetical protein E3U55_02150 [Filobacillus milosensis]|uniref:Lipoprotein n=1 Tax=Filobacillus milosensis TaxID=94137 RepID=A0A4Y8IRL7_9BACI|nr:hypothetical protein [Filobacillus milosensis]TFB24325.1 hypothetical protein E3U55_02150 [Filobacillus milosensis]